MLLSFEILRPQGAFAFVIAWATLLLLIRSGASSPAGVEEHVQTDIWVLQELERSCRLLGNIPGGVTGLINSRTRRRYSSAEERIQRVQPRYHQAKETKCGEMDGRKS